MQTLCVKEETPRCARPWAACAHCWPRAFRFSSGRVALCLSAKQHWGAGHAHNTNLMGRTSLRLFAPFDSLLLSYVDALSFLRPLISLIIDW